MIFHYLMYYYFLIKKNEFITYCIKNYTHQITCNKLLLSLKIMLLKALIQMGVNNHLAISQIFYMKFILILVWKKSLHNSRITKSLNSLIRVNFNTITILSLFNKSLSILSNTFFYILRISFTLISHLYLILLYLPSTIKFLYI